MARMACVDLPAFPLQLLLKRHPGWSAHPVAVVDRDRPQGILLWVNETARHHRIRPGMRYAAGLALAQDLRAAVVAASEIRCQLEEILQRLRFFTADVEICREEPGVFWLDASGLSLLYPSLARWADLIRRDLTAAGFQSTIVVGFSRFGTYAVAREGKGSHVFTDPAQENARAREVALRRLGLDPTLRDLLARLGIATLGAFLDLPAEGVFERLGVEARRLHRLARDELWSPLQPEALPEVFEAETRFDESPETDLDRLMTRIAELLRPLRRRWLEQERTLASVLVGVVLEDRSRRAEQLHPAQPTNELPIVLELIRLRFERIALDAGVVAVTLAVETAPVTVEQGDLFAERPRRDPAAANRAFARLRAELGESAVQCAFLREGHLPEASFTWKPLRELGKPSPRKQNVRSLVRRFFPRPRRLSSPQRHEPDGWHITGIEGGPVEEIVGPYVVSGGWWMREVHREYHYVRVGPSRWLWVYYDRRRRRWYLHGEVE